MNCNNNFRVYIWNNLIRINPFFVIVLIILIVFNGISCDRKGKQVAQTSDSQNDTIRRYLAIDKTLHGELQNVQMVMGQTRNQKVIFENFEDSWEEENSISPVWAGSIIRDHEGRFRMYYVLRKPVELEYGQATAIAFSDDGVNWTKPALNIAPALIDHPSCNLINVESYPGMIWGHWYNDGHAFYDENAPLESRYKLAWRVKNDMYVATSSDGLNFITHGKAYTYKSDTHHSFFYDPFRDEYVIYGRKRGDWETGDPDRRGIPRHSSKNWTDLPWTNIGQVVIDPMDVWDYTKQVRPQVYSPGIQIYHGQYIGLPNIFLLTVSDNRYHGPTEKQGFFTQWSCIVTME